MLKLALTGNIASGKSTVGVLLERKYGCPVIDCDYLVHSVLDNANPQTVKIAKLCDNEFGVNVWENSNKQAIDRKKLGLLFFSNIKLKKQIENILHPVVEERVRFFFNTEIYKKSFCAVNIIPLLFECKETLTVLYDYVCLVHTSKSEQKKRLLIRNPELTEEQIEQRISSQMLSEEKFSLCDFIIENNGSLEELESQIEKLWKNINKIKSQ